MKEKIKPIGKGTKVGGTTLTGDGYYSVKEKHEPDTVAVRDYTSSKGYSGIVHWDGKNPTVGGIKIEPTEIRDGIAYAKKSDMDNALARVDERLGIKDVQKMRDDKFGKAENDAFLKVTSPKEFSYDPDKDNVFQAYKKQYEREAENALRRILNDNNVSVTGASGAVLSEAMAAHDAELDKLTDVIPELYGDAYDRYIAEREAETNEYKAINEAADRYYDRLYQSNTDTLKRVSDAGEREREERQRIIENERNMTNDAYENALRELELLYRPQLYDAELAKTYKDIENIAADMVLEAREEERDATESRVSTEKTALDNAFMRGFFVAADEEVMPWLSAYRTKDGKYTLSPSVARVAYAYQQAHASEKGKIYAKLGK